MLTLAGRREVARVRPKSPADAPESALSKTRRRTRKRRRMPDVHVAPVRCRLGRAARLAIELDVRKVVGLPV